ncbi:sigma-70 family RNA polymerase sigma factor [Sinomicrobium sp. M5D2P17]
MDNYGEIVLKIHNYISKLTSEKELIDEVSQEVFLKVHNSIATLKDSEKLDAWLRRIVYTTLMDIYRKKQKEQTGKLLLTGDEAEPENEGNVALMECIVALLQLLPDEQRELMEAIEIKGISQAEYARQHNFPLSTVKSKVQRARQKIKELVKSNCILMNDKYGNVVDYALPEKSLKKIASKMQ